MSMRWSSGTYPPGPLKLNIVKLSISRNTQLLLSKASKYQKFGISLNIQIDNAQVEYLAKYSTWVEQADKSLDKCMPSDKNIWNPIV